MRLFFLFTVKPSVFCALLALSITGWAAAPLPQFGPDLHLGVATCSGSTCHGAAKPFKNSSVLQNEFITWQREDAHADAYKVLLNKESKRIARNLGLESAHTAKLCLDCHSDYVAKELRGKRFQLSDGIGCEACHGGAERYLGLHVSGIATHEDNIKNGLYPSENPIDRARLCLSCHFGNNNKFVTHRIMGAGHPRLSFELDTFTAIAPAHFKIDADYRERKQVWSHTKTWAIGQAMAVQEYVKQLARPQRINAGLFPELVFFDCYACHHPMENKRWGKRKFSRLEPGTIRLNDANMLMLRQIALIVDPGLAKKWKTQILALHKSSTQGSNAMIGMAKDIKVTTQALINKVSRYKFGKNTIRTLLQNVIDEGISGEYRDYSAAEQSLMAIDTLLTALADAGVVNLSGSGSLALHLDSLYQVLEDDGAYRPSQYIAGLNKLKGMI